MCAASLDERPGRRKKLYKRRGQYRCPFRTRKMVDECACWLVVGCLTTFASFASSDIREIGPVWDNSRDRPLPSESVIPPGADRSEFAVISSYPVSIVDRAQSGPRPRRVAATVRTVDRRQFTPTTARDISADPVLERYPGLLDLWSPYTEDPATNSRRNAKKPVFVPDTGFLLEH